MNDIQDLLNTLDACQKTLGSSGAGAHSKNLQIMKTMLTTVFSGGLADEGSHRRGGNPALRAQQTICRLIMTNATDFIAICDEDGRVQFANAACLHLLGYNPASLLSTPLFQLVHHEDASEVSRYWQKLLETGNAQVTMRYRHSNGSTRWLEVNGTSFRLSTGCQVVLVSRDVTERKQAEDALRESEELNRLITENVADLISIVNQEGRLVYVSPSYGRSLGYEMQQLLGSFAFDFMHPDDMPVMLERMQQLLGPDSDGVISQSSLRHRHADGSWRWLEVRATIIHRSNGSVQFVCVSRDVTERIQAEAALQEAAERCRLVLEQVPAAVYTLDRNLQITSLAGSGINNLGVSIHDAIGRSGSCLFQTNESSEAIDSRYRRALQGEIVRWEYLWDGQAYEVHAEPFRNVQGAIIGCIGIALDITNTRRAQELYRLITENSTDLVSLATYDGVATYASPSHQLITGYETETLPSNMNVLSVIHPDDIALVQQEWIKTIEEGYGQVTVRYAHADGSWRWLESHLRTISLSTGDAIHGTGDRILIVSRDITERRQEEESQRLLDRLRSLGMISSGIAHDFANLLTAVIGNLRLAEMLIPSEGHEEFRNSIDQALLASHNAVDLAKQITAFAKDQRQDHGYLNLSTVAGDMVSLLRASISRNVTLSHSLRGDIPSIQGDVTQIGQIILNLVINAGEAIGDDFGGIHISTGVRSITQDELKSQNVWFGDELGEGERVFLEVTDTGSGIGPEILSKIFEPFFTNKVTGRGLGLATVLQIIRSHGGALKVQSKFGVGTTFTVYFLPVDEHRHVTGRASSDTIAQMPIDLRSSHLYGLVAASIHELDT